MIEVKRQLFESFQPLFKQEGFEAVPNLWQFRKSFNGGFKAFILSISVYDDATIVELHLGVRHNPIENYIAPFVDGLSAFKPDMLTMMTSMGRLQGEVHKRYTISDDEDFQRTYDDLQLFVHHLGSSILEEWTDLKKLNQVYNSNPYDLNLIYNAYNKAVRGITIARFTNSDKFRVLKEKYSHFIHYKRYPQKHKLAFDKLGRYLDIYHPN